MRTLKARTVIPLFALVCQGLAVQSMAAEPPADPHAIWTFQDENASITTSNLPDRYYVNGLLLGYTSPTDAVPDFLSDIGHSVWGEAGESRQRFTASISQSIYTPADTKVFLPPPTDEPYAGVLTANLGLIQDTTDHRSILGLMAGLIGPDAGGQIVQNGFHSIIGQKPTKGWADYQIQDEPLVEFLSARIWRISLGSLGGMETDVLPDLSVGLGNLRIYAMTGGVVRIGRGLQSDFGVPRLFPGPNGDYAYTPVQPFDWYFFAGAHGSGVAHDITINGNSFRTSPSVSLQPLQGELEVGFAAIYDGMRISYTQVFQTYSFRTQRGGLHQFGSLAVSVEF